MSDFDLAEFQDGNLALGENDIDMDCIKHADDESEKNIIGLLTDKVAADDDMFLEGHLFPWLDD